MNQNDYKHFKLTEAIIKEAYYVNNTLGFGFLESVYENALALRLRKQGSQVKQQQPLKVFFEQQEVGAFFADMVVDGKVIVELKAVDTLHQRHEVQLVNYLRATGISVGLLINFGHRVSIKRKVFTSTANAK